MVLYVVINVIRLLTNHALGHQHTDGLELRIFERWAAQEVYTQPAL